MSTARRSSAVGARWLREERRVVSALLTEIEGSAPLEAGASMLIAEGGEIEGSITGGCVEGAVAQEALAVLAGGPPRQLTYGISDELAGTVGLTCGGIVHVFVHELAGAAREVELSAKEAIVEGRPVAVATRLEGEDAGSKLALIDGERVGGLGGPELLDDSVARDAAGMLAQGVTGVRRYGEDGAVLGAELAIHIGCSAPSPEMMIFGAIDFAAALARIAKEIGYRVTVCDPRAPFLESPRFKGIDTVAAWPQDALATRRFGARDAILVFTHDSKLDEPALRAALETEAGYIGALGSRRTTVDRNRRLEESGVDRSALSRVRAPCGLDIGGKTPDEAAISILAEIIAVRSGRDGAPLREGTGTIQPRLEAGQ